MGDPKITNVQNTVKNDTNKPQYDVGKIYSSYIARTAIFDVAKDNPQNTPVLDKYQALDAPYDYFNSGMNQKPAEVYHMTTGSTYTTTKRGDEIVTRSVIGQVQNEGNDVPIGNTLTAYILNNNPDAKATIQNTTPQGLAHNFFTTADNIQEVIAPNAQGADGQVISTNTDGSGETKLEPALERGFTPGNGNLNQAEIKYTALAYGLEAKAATLKESKNSDEQKRKSAASTVNIDQNDPYYGFFAKAAKLDGNEGVTEAELAMAIGKISEKKSNGLVFNKENLSKFMSLSDKDLQSEFKKSSANDGGMDIPIVP